MAATVDDVIAHMLSIKDKIAELAAQHKELIAPLEAQLARGEAWLQDFLNSTGQNSAKTDAGTAFIKVNTRHSVADKGAFEEFVTSTGELGLIEMRVSSSGVKQYMEDHDGELPPGITTSASRSVQIRRPSK